MNILTMDAVKHRALMHLRRDLTLNALDDFVPLSAVSWEIRERLDPDSEIAAAEVALSVVHDLLATGMIEVGDLVSGKVVAWQSSVESILVRIQAAFAQSSTSELGWLVATKTAETWAQRYYDVLKKLKP